MVSTDRRITGVNDSGELRGTLAITGGGTAGTFQTYGVAWVQLSNTVLAVNTTYFLACTWDGPGSPSTTTVSGYVNGVLERQQTDGAQGFAPRATLSWGRRYLDSFGNCFDGVMNDMRVYNRALNADDIAQLYHQGLYGHPDTLQWMRTAYISIPAAVGSAAGPLIEAGRLTRSIIVGHAGRLIR